MESRFARRLRRIAATGLLAWTAALGWGQATVFRDIDGAQASLHQIEQGEKVLLLVVRQREELSGAFKALTLAESRDLRCVIAIVEPPGEALKTAAMKRAARPYFQSDFSRQRILFSTTDPLPGARAALLARNASTRLWQSERYPEESAFDQPAFGGNETSVRLTPRRPTPAGAPRRSPSRPAPLP